MRMLFIAKVPLICTSRGLHTKMLLQMQPEMEVLSTIGEQSCSPFFQLPAELRMTIYDFLDLPPFDNIHCFGFILSCRQAKIECEKAAIRATKIRLAAYRRETLSLASHDIRILLPRTPPIEARFMFTTIRDLTIVIPGEWFHDILCISPTFFQNLRHLNGVFGLWLDRLVLHMRAAPQQVGERPFKNRIGMAFRRLGYILEGGFTYAHDPIGQAKEKAFHKYSSMWDYWQPQPAFIKQLVVSWDLTDKGIQKEGTVAMEGYTRKRPVAGCRGLRMHRAIGEDGLVGHFMRESSSRFRPLQDSKREHSEGCTDCGVIQDYFEYMHALPDKSDERWL